MESRNIGASTGQCASVVGKLFSTTFQICEKRITKIPLRKNNDVSFIPEITTSWETITHFSNLFEKRHKFAPESLARLHLLYNKGWISASAGSLQDEIVVLSLIEKFGRYLRGYSVMYDVDRFEKRNLSTWTFFNSIKYAISCPEIDWIDFGYGPPKIYPKGHHKLRYHPEDAPYWVRVCPKCGYMSLFHENHPRNLYHICPNCQYPNKFGLKERLVMTLTKISSQVKAASIMSGSTAAIAANVSHPKLPKNPN